MRQCSAGPSASLDLQFVIKLIPAPPDEHSIKQAPWAGDISAGISRAPISGWTARVTR